MDEQKRIEIELIRNSSPLDNSKKCVLHFYDTCCHSMRSGNCKNEIETGKCLKHTKMTEP